jgi:hypothetical protein
VIPSLSANRANHAFLNILTYKQYRKTVMISSNIFFRHSEPKPRHIPRHTFSKNDGYLATVSRFFFTSPAQQKQGNRNHRNRQNAMPMG